MSLMDTGGGFAWRAKRAAEEEKAKQEKTIPPQETKPVQILQMGDGSEVTLPNIETGTGVARGTN